MDVIFCGTPQFAVPTLERLLADHFSVRLVVTNPDEPSGRGYEPRAPAVKQAAERARLSLYQPVKLKDPATQEFLSRVRPDVIVVVAYGRIIPQWMIDLPRFGCVNLHASLLPKYRGAAPIQWAIIQGERVTGVTTIEIDAGLDTGDILFQREIEIAEDDTTETLAERLSRMGADLMVDTLRSIERGEITPRPQAHAEATLAPMLKKEDGWVNWEQDAEQIVRRTRGLRPWPGAHTRFRGKGLHLWLARPALAPNAGAVGPGALRAEGGKLFVGCGQGTLIEVMELQLEGRRRLAAREFLNGVRLATGETLG